jgi:hypothetical protein
MQESRDNRRRYFRIVDSLGVSYRIIKQGNHEEVDAENNISTLSVLNHHNTLIQEQLALVETTAPETAALIDQLNKKIDAILMMLELDNLMTQHACHRVDEASISASGIAFPIDEPLAPNAIIELDLLLRPSAKHVVAMGQIISCERIPNAEGYYLRVEFTEMSDMNREVLIQHIVQRQGVLLRALKEMDEHHE